MMKTKVINIAAEFSVEPAGRYYADGPDSGQRFRKEFLVKCLREFESVVVDFDGTEGSGSSFLDEAFAGLVKLEGFSKEDLHSRLSLKSDEDPSVISEVWSYIDAAIPEVKNAN